MIRALLVEIAGEPYAFPLSRIDRIFMLDRKDLRELEGKPHVMLDDQPVGLVEASIVLELSIGHAHGTGDRLPVVIASDRSHRFGVVVDRFLGERDLRVSPLDPRLGKVPDINSSSVLENGWPVLIVDVEDMIRSIDNMLSGRRLGKLASEVVQQKVRAAKRVLIVDDSITVRELERQLLENRGYTVTWQSTGSTAGMQFAAPIMIWSSATSTCLGWTVSSLCGKSRRMGGSRRSRWSSSRTRTEKKTASGGSTPAPTLI